MTQDDNTTFSPDNFIQRDDICSSKQSSNSPDLFPILTDFRQTFPSNFIFMYNNVNSYRNKPAVIHDMLTKNIIDFLAIAVTELGFELYRQDFTSKSGGLLVHVRDDIPQRRLPLAEVNSDGFESICIEITIGNKKLLSHPYISIPMSRMMFSNVVFPNSLIIYYVPTRI